jgi:hypothetical protein
LYKPVSLSFFITIALPMRAHDDGDRQVAKE